MLTTPFWFDQRQLQAESVGEEFYRITGPNAPEMFLGVRKADNGNYQAYLRAEKDGADLATTDAELPTLYNAWEAAFELYRGQVIV
jgi:hypothetical protein